MYLSTGEYVEPSRNDISSKNSGSKTNCRLSLRGMNPHPSETFPRIKCRQYNPKYCTKQTVKICERQDPNDVMVHLGAN